MIKSQLLFVPLEPFAKTIKTNPGIYLLRQSFENDLIKNFSSKFPII